MAEPVSIPRRAFLARVAALGVVGMTGTVAVSGPEAQKSETENLGLDRATCADFARHQGSSFRLHPGTGAAFEGRLLRVRESRRAAANGGRRSFSVVFAVSEAKLTQQIYHVEHDQLGTFSLFLVPVGRPKSGTRLEAVFG